MGMPCGMYVEYEKHEVLENLKGWGHPGDQIVDGMILKHLKSGESMCIERSHGGVH
jgi:hypothetical protein